jgi:pimeloyl-ACP methyl ester carboxylesterase
MRLAVNGTELAWESRGAGRPILFLHGFTLDRRMWRRQMDGLSNRFRTIAWDARGFGESAMPGDAPYKHCEDSGALCDALGIEGAIVVGHSIGGHHMLELCLTRPDRIAGFVAVALSGIASVPFPDEVMQLFAAVRQAARERSLDEAKQIWSKGGWFASARARADLVPELDAMLEDYSGWHWTNTNPAVNIEPPAARRLRDVKMPVLVITGDRDLPYNDVVGDALVAELPNARRLRLPAGHMANMEAPDAVNRAIADFAASI